MTHVADNLSAQADHATANFEGNAIEQSGAICLRTAADGTLQVLLITTRETGRWTIPKGWAIKGLLSHKVAEREAFEEAGVKGRAHKKSFGRYSYFKRMPDGVMVPASVTVHVIDVRRMKRKFPEQGQRKLTWVTPADAARMVIEPELQNLLRKIETRYVH